MNHLSKVYIFKISVTIVFWFIPLVFFPSTLLEGMGIPAQPTYLFVRLLGCAYLALCVGYAFGLKQSLKGKRAEGPLWMGIVSNGGASLILGYFGLVGSWASWGIIPNVLFWSSVVATAAITAGLIIFGVLGGSIRDKK